MICLLMMAWVVRNGDRTCIVIQDWEWCMCRADLEVFEELLQPKGLLSCIGGGHVFSLHR